MFYYENVNGIIKARKVTILVIYMGVVMTLADYIEMRDSLK